MAAVKTTKTADQQIRIKGDIMEQKPSYKSLEFWVGLAIAVVGSLLTTGVIGADTTIGKIIGAILAVFGSGSIVASRTFLKNTSLKINK